MDIGIRLKGVGLEVPHFVQQERSVRSWAATLFAAATSRFKRDYRVLLKDVSFEIHDGERVALLGRNGAGKTTLLRLLAGTLQPTQGMLEVKGSRQALLNLGLGFNAEATVRENIFLRGTAMGLRPSMIRDQVSAILDFAGLEPVANHRLATLSSGQRMRLGFAVSTSVQHDIMLLDEWFGAGDAEFVHKARARMSGRVAGSRIVILASHNFKMLKEVCSRGIVIDQGGVAFDGPLADAIEAYKMVFATTPEQREASQAELEDRIRNRERKEKLSVLRETLQEERRKLRAERKRIRELRRKIEASEAGKAQRELQAATQDAAGQEIDGSEPSR